MAKFLYRIGLGAARRAWLVVTAWVVILGIGAAAMLGFAGTLTTALTIPGLESQTVIDDLKTSFPIASRGSGTVVFSTENGAAFTVAQQQQISAALAGVLDVAGVADVVDPFATEAMITAKRAQVTGGLAQIESATAQLAAAQTKIDGAPAQLDAAEQKLVVGQGQLDTGVAQLAAAKADLEAKLTQLDAGLTQAKSAGAPQATIDGMLAQRQQLVGGLAEIGKKEKALAVNQVKIDAGLAEIARQRAALAAGQAKIDVGMAEIESNTATLAIAERLLAVSEAFSTVSADDATALGTVQFALPSNEIEASTFDAVKESLAASVIPGVQIEYSAELSPKVESILGVGEIVGLMVAAIVLFVMLGTLIGAGLPVISALLGVGVSATTAMALSGSIEMTTTTPVLGVMLGLGVGIDYTLFILNRHRRQLKAGVELRESIGLANGTSGSAVLFAGMTVVIALAALNLTGIGFLGLMGSVAAGAIIAAVLVALTLTPALLSLVGVRVLSKKERAKFAAEVDHSAAATPRNALQPVWANRHPWIAILLVSVAVLTLAIPAASLRLGLPDGSSEALESTQYQAYKLTSEAFGEGANGPVLVIASLADGLGETAELRLQADIAERIMALENVDAVVPAAVSDDHRKLMFQVMPTTGPASEETAQLVRDIRDIRAAVERDFGVILGVTGLAAMNIDISKKIADVLPLYLGTVLLLSLLLLIVVFRSIAVPVLASAGFLASILATFGAVVAVFQWGWLGGVFGVHDPGPVLSFLPIILIGVLFGLAMDYQLFITSGMREAHIHGRSSHDSVNYGVHLSRAVVVAAAIIMIFVFGGFAFSHMAMIRPMGFGMAFGVLVDAFLVRLVLVPAVMTILGEKAWWIPRWLDRILPDVDIEGAALEREHLH